jgi:hypothetical protein
MLRAQLVLVGALALSLMAGALSVHTCLNSTLVCEYCSEYLLHQNTGGSMGTKYALDWLGVRGFCSVCSTPVWSTQLRTPYCGIVYCSTQGAVRCQDDSTEHPRVRQRAPWYIVTAQMQKLMQCLVPRVLVGVLPVNTMCWLPKGCTC